MSATTSGLEAESVVIRKHAWCQLGCLWAHVGNDSDYEAHSHAVNNQHAVEIITLHKTTLTPTWVKEKP